jgi:hypothetical protein
MVGAVADPTKSSIFKISVGLATPSISLRAVRLSNGVPVNMRSFGQNRIDWQIQIKYKVKFT